MKIKRKLKICFMGGKQAGIIGVLAILAKGHEISSAVSYSDDLTQALNFFDIHVNESIKDRHFIEALKSADLLFSSHGRERVTPDLLKLPKLGSVNIHPFLYKYKGADPVGRALKDKERRASVGAHIIEEKIDAGKVLVEEFIDIPGASNVDEIYNKLYPSYCTVILKVLDMMSDEKK